MKEFGIYTFAFKKDAPKSSIVAYRGSDYTPNDFMVGEIDLSSKAYIGLPLEVACKKRIAQELKAKKGVGFFDMNDIVDLKCFRIHADKASHVDDDIRKFIIKYIKGTAIVKDTNEVIHSISRHWLNRAIEKYVKNDTDVYRVDSFDLYTYQKELKAKALAWLHYHTRCLFHLSTRGGKSFLSLITALEDGANNILILTPFPAAQESFADIVKFHTRFTGWRFYTKEDIDNNTKFQSNHNVILLSWQIFDKDLEKQKIKNIFDQITFTHAIIDETHNTSASVRSQAICDSINDDVLENTEEIQSLASITDEAVAEMNSKLVGLKEIHLSGTPYNDILSARFTKDETFTFDFMDLIKFDKQTHEVGFPELNIFNLCNMTTLNDLLVKVRPDVFEREEGFSLKKAFATKARTMALLDLLFDVAFNPESSDTFDGTEDNRLVFDGKKNKHVLCFVPTIKAASWAADYLKAKFESSSSPILNKYKVLAVSGETSTGNDIDTSAKKGGLEKYVNEFEAANDYTIVITCLKLTTGVTLRKTDSILLMRNCSSVETFIQILFRAMTPNKEKSEANLYCLDSDICLNVVKETLKIRQEHDNQTDTDHIKELFGIMNFKKFWANDGFEFDITNASEWLAAVKDIPVNLNLLKMLPTAALSCMITDLTQEQKEALLSLEPTKTEIKKKAVAEGVGGNIKQRNYKTNAVKGSHTTSQIEQLLARLETLFAHLDWAIINNDITSIEDLFNNYHIELEDGKTPNFVRN